MGQTYIWIQPPMQRRSITQVPLHLQDCCYRSGLPWVTPLLLICAGLAWADNVLSLNKPGCLFEVITDHPCYAPLGLELENHVEGSISINILQGRLHRSGLSTSCTKTDHRWLYIRSLNSLGRENGYRNHIYTFRINGIVQPGVGVEGYLGGPHGI